MIRDLKISCFLSKKRWYFVKQCVISRDMRYFRVSQKNDVMFPFWYFTARKMAENRYLQNRKMNVGSRRRFRQEVSCVSRKVYSNLSIPQRNKYLKCVNNVHYVYSFLISKYQKLRLKYENCEFRVILVKMAKIALSETRTCQVSDHWSL